MEVRLDEQRCAVAYMAGFRAAVDLFSPWRIVGDGQEPGFH